MPRVLLHVVCGHRSAVAPLEWTEPVPWWQGGPGVPPEASRRWFTVEAYALYGLRSAFLGGQLYAQRGNRDEALDHYTTFLDTFTDPDPEYEWMVEEARAEVERSGRGRQGPISAARAVPRCAPIVPLPMRHHVRYVHNAPIDNRRGAFRFVHMVSCGAPCPRPVAALKIPSRQRGVGSTPTSATEVGQRSTWLERPVKARSISG